MTEIDAELAALGGDERDAGPGDRPAALPGRRARRRGVDDADEEDRWRSERTLLADAVGHREAALRRTTALADDGGAGDAVAAALAALDRAGAVPRARRAPALRVLAELDDVAAELRDRGRGDRGGPERLADVRARRQLLRDLRRKYGDDLAEVIALRTARRRRASTSWRATRSGPPARRASAATPSPPSAGGRRSVGARPRAAPPPAARRPP